MAKAPWETEANEVPASNIVADSGGTVGGLNMDSNGGGIMVDDAGGGSSAPWEAPGAAAPAGPAAEAPEGDDQNWMMGVIEKLSGATDSLTQGATFGWGDEATAAESAFRRRRPGKEPEGFWETAFSPFSDPNSEEGFTMPWDDDWDKRYNEALYAERTQQEQFAEENPGTSLAAEIAGSVIAPLGAGKWLAKGGMQAGKALSALSPVTKAAGLGAAGGAVYGAGDSEGDVPEMMMDMLKGGAMGGVVGGATAKLLPKAANLYKKLMGKPSQQAAKTAPTMDQLEAGAKKAYQAVEDLGISYKTGYTDNAFRNLTKEVQKAGAHPTSEASVFEVLGELENWRGVKPGKAPITVSDLDKMRQHVSKNLMKQGGGSDRHYGSQILQAIDDIMEGTADPNLLDAAFTGNVKKAMPAIKHARASYGRMRKADLVNDALERATFDTAAAGSGGNINNNIRRELKKILTGKRTGKYFSAEEKAVLQKAITGGKLDNFYRLVGKLSPQGNGLMMAMNLMASGVNPATLVGTGAAMGAKKMGDRATIAAANRARDVMTGGMQFAGPRSMGAGMGGTAAAAGGLASQMNLTGQ